MCGALTTTGRVYYDLRRLCIWKSNDARGEYWDDNSALFSMGAQMTSRSNGVLIIG